MRADGVNRPGAGAGRTRWWAKSSAQRRAPAVVQHAEDEPHGIGAEVRRGDIQLHTVARHPRLRRAARARRQLAVQRLRGRKGRSESAPGLEPREDEDDEGRHHPGTRRLVRVLRSGVCEPDRSERARARAAGAERGRARFSADEPHRARQRGVRDSDGLHAHQGHGPAVDRARHERTGSSAHRREESSCEVETKKRKTKNE